jgi:hypothetical protein
LVAVSNAGAQQALDYLLAFGDNIEDTPLGEELIPIQLYADT